LKLSEGRMVAAAKSATFAGLSHGADRLLLEGLANQLAISGPPLRGPGSPGDWGSTPADPPKRLLETLSTIAVNRRGPPPLPRAELGIHGLNRWTVNCMEMYEKRGVQAARNGPSPSPCVARPEMSMADRLGSRERAAGATHFVTPMSACTRSTFISTGRASGSD